MHRPSNVINAVLIIMSLSGVAVSAQGASQSHTLNAIESTNTTLKSDQSKQAADVKNISPASNDRMVTDARDTKSGNALTKGDTAYLSGDYNSAILAYREALNLNPDNQMLLQKLGEAYFSAGEDEEALLTFRLYLQKHTSGTARIHYVLGVLLERQGDIEAAVAEYDKVMSTDPNHSGTLRRLADIYLIRGEFKKAIKEYSKLHEASPNNPILLYKLARVYVRDKQFDSALKAYRQAINLDSGNIEIQREYASLHKQLGNYTEAETTYTAILKKKPDDEVALNGIIVALVKQKKYEELTYFLEKQQELDPGDPNRFYRLGLIYEYRRMYQEALDAYRRSSNVKVSAKAYHALGRVLLKTGKKTEAKEALESARKINPKEPQIRNLLMQLEAEDRVKNLNKNKKAISKIKKKKVLSKKSLKKSNRKAIKTKKAQKIKKTRNR